MKVGDTVWIFDANRRVYGDKTKMGSGPIWREHWSSEVIVSETSRSWVTKYGTKVPKKDAPSHAFAFSEDEVTKRAWVHDHCHRISESVLRCKDYELLQKVAEIVGYQYALAKSPAS